MFLSLSLFWSSSSWSILSFSLPRSFSPSIASSLLSFSSVPPQSFLVDCCHMCMGNRFLVLLLVSFQPNNDQSRPLHHHHHRRLDFLSFQIFFALVVSHAFIQQHEKSKQTNILDMSHEHLYVRPHGQAHSRTHSRHGSPRARENRNWDTATHIVMVPSSLRCATTSQVFSCSRVRFPLPQQRR